MKAASRHIPSLLLLMLLLFSSCNMGEQKLIPRSKLSKIYAEMLLTDQWIQETPSVRQIADTSLIYEPILHKYGYDRLDYVYTVNAYLDDPERFARIWRGTVDILDARIKELRKQRDQINGEEEKRRNREKFAVDFKIDSIFPYMYHEPFVHYHDSLAIEMDTLTCDFSFISMETSDTTYDGLVMNIKVDTLALSDSLPQTDSLLKADPLPTVDRVEKLVDDPAMKVIPVDTKTAVKKTVEEKQLPLRQVKRPTYNKDLKGSGELKMVEELKK